MTHLEAAAAIRSTTEVRSVRAIKVAVLGAAEAAAVSTGTVGEVAVAAPHSVNRRPVSTGLRPTLRPARSGWVAPLVLAVPLPPKSPFRLT